MQTLFLVNRSKSGKQTRIGIERMVWCRRQENRSYVPDRLFNPKQRNVTNTRHHNFDHFSVQGSRKNISERVSSKAYL